MNLRHYFRVGQITADPRIPIGCVHLTVAEQEVIVAYVESLEKKLGIEHKDQYLFGSES